VSQHISTQAKAVEKVDQALAAAGLDYNGAYVAPVEVMEVVWDAMPDNIKEMCTGAAERQNGAANHLRIGLAFYRALKKQVEALG